MSKIQYQKLERQSRYQAAHNMEVYGHTERIAQLAIMQEQLGKLSRAYTHSDPKIVDEYARLYRLMAMCYNYWIELEREMHELSEYDEETLMR